MHKDFHGALNCGFQYVKDRYGQDGLEEYWRRIARNCYGPLLVELRSRGLQALEEHWNKVFEVEGGDYKLYYIDETLVLEVERCPAIDQIEQMGYPLAEGFCRHCEIINKEICEQAGLGASCTYRQAVGSCRQKFWSLDN